MRKSFDYKNIFTIIVSGLVDNKISRSCLYLMFFIRAYPSWVIINKALKNSLFTLEWNAYIDLFIAASLKNECGFR